MRFVFLLAFFCLFNGFVVAQDGGPREIWCEMLDVSAPNVKEYKDFCTKLYAVFPSAQKANTYPIKKKIYLNKMRGVLLRGKGWDKLSPKQRTDLAKFGVELTNTYLGLEPGFDNPQPAGFKLDEKFADTDHCVAQHPKYDDPEACIADANYVYKGCIQEPDKKTDISKFWCVLHRVAATITCD